MKQAHEGRRTHDRSDDEMTRTMLPQTGLESRHEIDAESESAQSDFDGISSSRMHRILTGTLEENGGFVELSNELSDEIAWTNELVGTIGWLLGFLVDQRAKSG